ncbi:DUF1120 domain-containing protein [Herbaspirillum sp. LeCh32-8]|uniref:DUF1120 domain-containing protein n=1 Tax=Herbaspirillum sp. LeCh32-8 TaxID=2821356 RepID=UPI001AEA39A8|nr:DUF1120 domain-containing protein [Herbaspirillum sp. LeCh32-8]MBP0598406.1 DUF1120 domain-containing protein [Herbaspirillum sp. LeCh32-8]
MPHILARTAFAALVTVLASSASFAASTTEVKVTGTVKPPACLPSFSGGGGVSYGVIPAASLTKGAYTVLEKKSVAFTIQCDAPVKIAFKTTDNRASSRVSGITNGTTASPSDAYNYGLGTVSGKNVGGYTLSIDETTQVDGVATKNIFSGDNGSTWAGGVGDIQHDGHYFSFGPTMVPVGGSIKPTALKTLSATINVKPVLNKPENLPLSADVPIDGSATVEVIYL